MKTSERKKNSVKPLKSRQAELLDSKKDLAAIFSAMTEIILLFDNKGNYFNIIPTGSKDFYQSPNKLIGKNITEIFDKETAKLFLKNIKYVAREKEIVQFEYLLKIKRKDTWFSATLSPFNHNKVLWVARNITKQKLIELDQITSSAKYRKLMEEANDAIFIADAKTGKLLEANRKAQVLIGRPLKEIRKMHQSDLHPKKEIKNAKREFRLFSEGSSGGKNLQLVQHKNGSTIPVEITTSLIEINSKKYVQGIFRDISEEIRTKEKLKDQVSFMEQVYMQSSLSTQILDKEGWCYRINPKLTELFGVQPEDIEGKKYNIFKDKSLIDGGIIPILKRVFEKGETAEWDILFDIGVAADSQNIRTFQNQKKWFHNKAYPVFDKDGEIQNVIIHHENITEKKINEEKIKMLAFSLGNISECVSITNLDNKIIYVNDAFLNTYGYKSEEIIGKEVDCLRPRKLQKALCPNSYPNTIKGNWQGELINIKKDGTQFPINLSTAIVRDEDKQPIALIGIASDITERLKHEKLLRESEEKYRVLAEASQDMIFIVDKNGEILYVNNFGSAQFGLKPEDMIGKKRSEFFDNTSSARQESRFQKIYKTKESVYIEDKTEFPDRILYLGTWLIPIKDSSDHVVSIMGVSRDITERINHENELRKLSSAVEQSPVSVLISNLSGDIEYVNPTFTKVTGFTFDEVKGKNPRILSSGETPSAAYKELWETIKSGKTWQGEFHNKRKNGELFWEFASISPIKDKKGTTTNFIAIKEDITERKLAQMELVAAKEKAEEMNSLKTKFLANMSHELRTPLIGVLGYAEILKDDLKLAEQKEMAGTIHENGKRLLHTLNLLLDLTRIESDKEDLFIREIDVGEVAKKAVKLFDINAANKNLLLTTSIINNIKANLDERIFIQIINNLVNNAIKFTDNGKITIEIDTENDDVILRVRDTGIGIPKDKQQIIFEEFRQVSEGLNRRHQGTGLGLTITKKYIEILNGTISVNSEINNGSVFTVKIPSGNLN